MDPIETEYNGYRFRSRLEARWAVFFDELDLSWDYEPEGFEFEDGTRYLPDFWLPVANSWIEIKGSTPTWEEVDAIYRLGIESDHCSLLISGDPANHTAIAIPGLQGNVGHAELTQCRKCEALALDFGHDGWSIIGDCPKECSVKGILRHESYEEAATSARSARFEHGESGAR